MGNLDVASEALAKLSARAKEAETHAKAARDETKADLERHAGSARIVSGTSREAAREGKRKQGKISAGWAHMQQTWSEHIAKIRADIESKKAKHDPAEKRAEHAERDASFGIEYAFAAIEEAEYAVLDAALARMDADELAAAGAGA